MRRLWVAVVSLLIGLVLTTAIPIAVGTRILPRGRGETTVTFEWEHPYGVGWLATVDQSGWGWTRRGRSVVAPQSYGMAGAALTLSIEAPTNLMTDPYPIEMAPGATLADLDPALVSRLQASPPSGTLLVWPIQMRLGWPMRCLAYSHVGYYGWGAFGWGSTGARGIAGGVPLGPVTAPFEARVVPYRPLWPGILVNMLVLGGAAFLVVESLRRLRARRRVRAGHCPACGYDMRGLAACPECGRAADAGRPAAA